MYKLIVGKIAIERQADWFRNDDDPYAVWEGEALIQQICTIGTLSSADDFLRDRVDVDWGSVAWKANRQELDRFFKAKNIQFSSLHTLEPNIDYAVIFIENVWGDSA